MYTLDLLRSVPKRGFYRLSISAKLAKPDARLVGHTGAPLQVKVLGTVAVEAAEIGTADADQTTAPKLNRVTFPGKAGFVVEADWHQRLLMRFTLKDQATKEPMTVHQAFVKLTNQATGQEIIFVAEPDSSKVYRFDMDIGSRAGDFLHLSGRYTLALLVGDAVLSNSFLWEVAEVSLSFASTGSVSSTTQSSDMYKPKSEIKHMFREPDKRPPATVSSLFTVLVCLPLLVLLGLWAKLGVNISNFPFSLSALGFHLGLGGIFGLFAVFWLQLNMFQTLKYLLAVGVITFLCGNKLLAKLAANRQHR
ncbi:hypothetical protein B566_EDAN015351 [Ephemera danica]|nr:hypothetical protein B566_EDAN015351 [Ephemera danica]